MRAGESDRPALYPVHLRHDGGAEGRRARQWRAHGRAEMVDEKLPVPVTLKLPDANVPLVVKFSFPNEMEPDESVILPLANVKFPIIEPVAAVNIPLDVIAPDETVPKPETLPLVSNV